MSGDDVFVDYGSGMGRVLIIAGHEPFKRVIGVEMSEQLNEVARENLDHNRDRFRCQESSDRADATQWQVPDDVTIVYFYCRSRYTCSRRSFSSCSRRSTAGPAPAARLLLHGRR